MIDNTIERGELLVPTPRREPAGETRPEPAGATRPDPAGATPPRWRPQRPLAFLIALGFFFGPLVAYLAGERPQEIENRALVDFPSVSDGWSFFPDVTSWSIDHLPLRGQAVRAHAEVTERLLGEAPSYYGSGTGSAGDGPVYPSVIEGQEGWLYFGLDTSNLCQPTQTLQDTMARLERLARAVEASGRTFVMTVAPDKSTIYPDALPETFLGRGCAQERRDAFWESIRSAPPTGYVDLRGPLEEQQRSSGTPVYRPTDTHWTSWGAAIYARELARALDPALAESSAVVDSGPVSRTGDLGRLIGSPTEDQWQGVQLTRAGVTPVGRESLIWPELPVDQPVTVLNSTTGAPLFQPRTAVFGDSFTNSSRLDLAGLFGQASLLHDDVALTRPQVAADAMAGADVVVYEVVERNLASGRGTLLGDAALTAIEKTLAAQPR
jgi:hypothetical protein